MSPEQARGQSMDARSDIWSLGVVLYEMVRGIPPFHGETPSDCIASILTTEPPPLSSMADVPLKFESIRAKGFSQKQRRALPDDQGNARGPPQSQGDRKQGLLAADQSGGDSIAAKSNVTSEARYSLWRRRSWLPRRLSTLLFSSLRRSHQMKNRSPSCRSKT